MYQLFAAMPLLFRSGFTRQSGVLRRGDERPQHRFKALRPLQDSICSGQQPGKILSRLREENTPQAESRQREKQAYAAKDN